MTKFIIRDREAGNEIARFDSYEEALNKYEELKALNLTIYHESNRLLDIYQVYIEECDFHDDEIWDSYETIKFFTDTNVRWGA